jgi:hypothetical protein
LDTAKLGGEQEVRMGSFKPGSKGLAALIQEFRILLILLKERVRIPTTRVEISGCPPAIPSSLAEVARKQKGRMSDSFVTSLN